MRYTHRSVGRRRVNSRLGLVGVGVEVKMRSAVVRGMDSLWVGGGRGGPPSTRLCIEAAQHLPPSYTTNRLTVATEVRVVRGDERSVWYKEGTILSTVSTVTSRGVSGVVPGRNIRV